MTLKRRPRIAPARRILTFAPLAYLDRIYYLPISVDQLLGIDLHLVKNRIARITYFGNEIDQIVAREIIAACPAGQ